MPEVQTAVSKAAQTAAENVIKQGGSKEEANAAANKAAQAAVTAAANLEKQNPNAKGADLANAAQQASKPVVEAFQKDKNAKVDQIMPKPADKPAAKPAEPKPEEAGAKPAEPAASELDVMLRFGVGKVFVSGSGWGSWHVHLGMLNPNCTAFTTVFVRSRVDLDFVTFDFSSWSS